MSTVYIRIAAPTRVPWLRSSLLERLLARASAPVRLVDWRADAFRVLAPVTRIPAAGSAAWHAATSGAPGATRTNSDAWVYVATPVRLNAGMTAVAMPTDYNIALDAAEAVALAEDFNRELGGDGTRLLVGRQNVLLCSVDAADVQTYDPDLAAGNDLFAFQPNGGEAARLRRLMSETEMWLFGHEVNRAREAHSKPVIAGFWLWGGGATRAPFPDVKGWAAGADPLFSAFGAVTEWPQATGPGVVVCAEQPGTSDWIDVEHRWLEPAMKRLSSGLLSSLELSAGGWRVGVRRGLRWPIWRRPRPWWESFALIPREPYGVQ